MEWNDDDDDDDDADEVGDVRWMKWRVEFGSSSLEQEKHSKLMGKT